MAPTDGQDLSAESIDPKKLNVADWEIRERVQAHRFRSVTFYMAVLIAGIMYSTFLYYVFFWHIEMPSIEKG